MRKLLRTGLIVLGTLALSVLPAWAQSASVGESITSFEATLAVQRDSSVRVTEHIVYDFGTNQRHGIYRDIPVEYSSARGGVSIDISAVTVVDASGAPYQFSLFRQGANERIKIGNPDAFISGSHDYIIAYTVSGAVSHYQDFDEVYWNITGNSWQVPIDVAGAHITLPSPVSIADLRVSCYYGPAGSTAQCANPKTVLDFAAPRPLAPGEGLTVAVGFPKGVVTALPAGSQIWIFIKHNYFILLPILLCIVLFLKWRKSGHDPKGRGTIIPEYDVPDGLTPLQVAAIVHEKIKFEHLSAEIMYLATRGYIHIQQTGSAGILSALKGDKIDYVLKRLKNDEGLVSFDKDLMTGLFGDGDTVTLSALKNVFYSTIPSLKKDVYASVVTNGYFKKNPEQVHAGYMGFAILFAIIGFISVLKYNLLLQVGLTGAIELLVCPIIIAIFAFLMPARTQKGVDTYEALLGLKEYLQIAERDRINFHNAPERKPEVFEKLLPYAMVLGAAKIWAKEFEGIYTTPPSWYSGPPGTAFNAIIFTNSLNSFSMAAAGTMSSAPSSSGSGGGGFSGGGFGGGGGGSW